MKKYTSIVLAVIIVGLFTPRVPAKDIAGSIVGIERTIEIGVRTNGVLISNRFTATATAWFYKSGKYLVTAKHVADTMKITEKDWVDVRISYQPDFTGRLELTNFVPMRLYFVRHVGADGIAVLELKQPFKGAKPLKIRTRLPVVGEKVKGFGYFDGLSHFSEGKCVKFDLFGKPSKPTEAFFEFRNPEDMVVLDKGSSGGPVLDKDNNVVAILTVSTFITMDLGEGPTFRVPSPNGLATNKGIPSSMLGKIKRQEVNP